MRKNQRTIGTPLRVSHPSGMAVRRTGALAGWLTAALAMLLSAAPALGQSANPPGKKIPPVPPPVTAPGQKAPPLQPVAGNLVQVPQPAGAPPADAALPGEAPPVAASQAQAGAVPPGLAGLGNEDEINQFCASIADAAKDKRYLMQKAELEKLQQDVDQRIAILEKRKIEYEDWLTKRNEFMKLAEANMISVYKTMKPDAAAPQLQEMNPILAAAIIMKLPPKQSGQVLTEMDPKKASLIGAIMANAGDPKTSKETQ